MSMAAEEPHKHHYVPQFFLRNFAIDADRKKVLCVTKNGSHAVWAQSSIENIGYEDDLYVHSEYGVPVSVETRINTGVETPISRSDTWAKIASGRGDLLDPSDRPILYSLIRHLEARTPQRFAMQMELAAMAADPASEIRFTDDERAHYAAMRANPAIARAVFNMQASSLEWTAENYTGAMLVVMRSRVKLRTSTAPVISMKSPPHPAMALPLPDMVPYQTVLMLNPYTAACLVLGDFDDHFANIEISNDTARGLNRTLVGQFAHFDAIRHVIADRDDLLADMDWAHFGLVKDTPAKIVFKRAD